MGDTSARSDVGFRSERGPILVAIMLAIGLVAIETTVLATAIPAIVADLGGFDQFPWLFSVYLLATAVTVPIYSKLADTIGRKPVILFGIGLFLLGSILGGFAWSIPSLIVFRAIQGLGAGATQPLAMIIAGDIYSVAERAKVQGYLVGVWAVASIIGPVIGGVFTQYASWRWIFFVNIPICLAAAWMIQRNLHENLTPRKHRIDYLGAALLALALTLLMLATLEGGQAWAWDSWQSIGAFALGAVFMVAFVLAERRAAEPIVPFWVLTRRLLLTTAISAFLLGAVLLVLTSYVPTYLVVTADSAPLLAGLALGTMTIGWPVSAALAGNLFLRFGFRTTVLIGFVFVLLGLGALAFFVHSPSIVIVAIGCFVVGLGLGLAIPTSMIAAQSSVPWNERGVVTGLQVFTRTMGGAIGVAILGAVANSIFEAGGGETDVATFEQAMLTVLLALLVASVLALAASIAMPRHVEPDASS